MDKGDMKSLALLRKKVRVRGSVTISVPIFIGPVRGGTVTITNHEGDVRVLRQGDTYILEGNIDIAGGADHATK